MLVFGDEILSRRRFWVEKSLILATKPNLVTVFGLGMLNFDDEILSRRRFG
jgi:hypothetical protein